MQHAAPSDELGGASEAHREAVEDAVLGHAQGLVTLGATGDLEGARDALVGAVHCGRVTDRLGEVVADEELQPRQVARHLEVRVGVELELALAVPAGDAERDHEALDRSRLGVDLEDNVLGGEVVGHQEAPWTGVVLPAGSGVPTGAGAVSGSEEVAVGSK